MRRFAFLLLLAVFTGLATRAETTAVLPFASQASSATATPASLEWIGDSIAETVRDAIELRGGVTLAREDVEDAFVRLNLRPLGILTQASVLKLGELLDAEQVIYGTFEFTRDPSGRVGAPSGSLKISARVFDRRKLMLSAEFSETGSLEDLPTLEAHLAWRTLVLIAPSLAPPESQFRTLRPSVRLDAQENYIRGLLAREPAQQERLFLQAARIDPKFGHVAYQLGRINYERKDYRQAAQWLQKMDAGDVHAHEAGFLLGLALFQAGDFSGAQNAFQKVADAAPLNEVLNNLGAAQSRRRLPQSVESFSKARDGDLTDPIYEFNLGYALWKKGDFPLAADHFRASLQRQPDDETATILLGLCLRKQGPRPSDAQWDGLERLKTNFEERAYRQLKALVGPGK